MAFQLVSIFALICLVSADVSELLRQPSKIQSPKPIATRFYTFNTQQVQPQYYTVPHFHYNNHGPRQHLYDSIIVDQPLGVPYTVISSPEPTTLLRTNPTVIDTNTGIAYQVTVVQPDTKGPYHYNKPKQPIVDYLAPIKTPNDDYLPPVSSTGKSS
ncbi:uncharacterized protein LOC131692014 [Topomyia yanbarensis]|uniref:uncharacterized protein LOC131692014 n=1 Tax=Topomyia yanbarensis TaxID=2498891 RepID=UPI00273BD86B|nr:uncharacterized protein LOC131692014 [Topomyia yanbarensis]